MSQEKIEPLVKKLYNKRKDIEKAQLEERQLRDYIKKYMVENDLRILKLGDYSVEHEKKNVKRFGTNKVIEFIKIKSHKDMTLEEGVFKKK